MWRLAILAVLAGCLDLSLPAAQRAGSVAVTALVPDPASPTLSPATTAELELIGSGLSTRATEDGNLLLGGITQTTGTLALSATLPSGERFERRFDVAASGIGPGRSVSLGVVTLSRGATITGVVRRPALPNPTGHAGVQVFLPGSPRTTFSADDGFYALGPVPQGQLSIGFFTPGARVHFEPVAVAGSGEVRLGSIQLEPDAKDAGVQSGFRVSVVDEAGAEIGEGVVRVLQATGTIGGAITGSHGSIASPLASRPSSSSQATGVTPSTTSSWVLARRTSGGSRSHLGGAGPQGRSTLGAWAFDARRC